LLHRGLEALLDPSLRSPLGVSEVQWQAMQEVTA
jgi:hypothetical protein